MGTQANFLVTLLPVLLPLAILVVPLADLVLAVVRRTRAGRSPFSPDKQHLHHRLLEIGHSQRRAVLIMWMWAALIAGGMVLASLYTGPLDVDLARRDVRADGDHDVRAAGAEEARDARPRSSDADPLTTAPRDRAWRRLCKGGEHPASHSPPDFVLVFTSTPTDDQIGRRPMMTKPRPPPASGPGQGSSRAVVLSRSRRPSGEGTPVAPTSPTEAIWVDGRWTARARCRPAACGGRDLIGLGGLLAGSVIVCTALGYLLDQAADSTPAFTLVGIALGMVAGARRLLAAGALRTPRPGLVMRWSDARASEHDRGCDPDHERAQPAAEPGPVTCAQKASLLPRPARPEEGARWSPRCMVVATYWIAGQFGEWELAGLHLRRRPARPGQPPDDRALAAAHHHARAPSRSRGQMIASTLTRLGAADRRRGRRRHRLLAQRHRPAAGPGHLPTDRPGDDGAAAAEGVEARMTDGLVASLLAGFPLAEGGEEGRQRHRDRPPRPARVRSGMTFNIDTIASTHRRRR